MVRVKSRTADQSEDVSVTRIHRDHCAIVPFQCLFRGNLYIQINRQLERFAGFRGSLAEASYFFPVTIDEGTALAIFADENIVILLLHSGLANDIALAVQLELRTVEVILADF